MTGDGLGGLLLLELSAGEGRQLFCKKLAWLAWKLAAISRFNRVTLFQRLQKPTSSGRQCDLLSGFLTG